MFRNILSTNKLLFTKTFKTSKKFYSENNSINPINSINSNKIPNNYKKFFKYLKSYLIISSISTSAYCTYKQYILSSQELEMLKNIFHNENIKNTLIYKNLISVGIASFILGPVAFPIIIISDSYEYIKSIIKN